MQVFIFCLFVVAALFVVLGFRKSFVTLGSASEQHCDLCGWTREQVQLCRLEQHHKTMVVSLCFDCSIEHDAPPVRDVTIGSMSPSYV